MLVRTLTHPMTAALAITAVAGALAAALVVAPHPLLWPVLLTVSGVATGFANSGST